MPLGAKTSLRRPGRQPPGYGDRLTNIGPASARLGNTGFRIKAMILEINLGDVIRLKKKHPCGGCEWQVVRLGADIGIKCIKCQRRVLLERAVFERRVKAFVSRGKTPSENP